MAELSTVGVPTVMPDAGAAPVNRTSASAASFGGQTAQALEGIGQATSKVADFFGDVVVDDQANQLFDKWNKKLRGDPNQMVPGPDGQPQPDTGYMGLKGKSALEARPQFEKGLDEDLKEARTNIFSPKMQQKFDDQTRRYRQHVVGLAGSHADGQASQWYDQVNKASGNIALTHIANNAENPVEVAAGASDLINARVKDAQLKGGGPELIQQAVEGAKRDALTAQLNAISVKDPEKALRMLDKNRSIAGLQYDELSRSFRARADQQSGDNAANGALIGTYQTIPPANAAIPVLDQAGQRYGISPSYLQRTRQIESGGNDQSVSPTGARGPFQFTGGTAKQYGLTNPHDLQASADAAARLAADNKVALTASFGRLPTDAELYLAHQQGAGGAAVLLRNPNVPAADALAPAYFRQAGGDYGKAQQLAANAIRVNGGNPNAPAAEFTSMWAARFGGGSGGNLTATLAARKADAYSKILEDPNLTDAARQHALSRVSQTIAALQVSEGQAEKVKKEANDQAADGYVRRMLKGDYSGIVDQIAADPHLTWETRTRLGGMAQKSAEESSTEAAKHYGAGFFQALKAINAPVGDPSRINDPSGLYERAQPGGDLTLAGVAKLTGVMKDVTKSVDNASVHTSKIGLMNYAKSKLSFEADTGPIKIRDPKGEAIFNAEFIPKFEAAYDQWIKANKNPWEFLTRENIDKLITGMRSKSQMEMDRLAATGQSVPEDKNAPMPPAPKGVEGNTWATMLAKPPPTEDGKPFPRTAWAKALTLLAENPTPENIKLFNESKFGRIGGYDAQKLLDRMTGKPAPAGSPDTPLPDTINGIPRPGAWRS